MEYMRKFLEACSDDYLVALLDHLPKLSFYSCCCFVGGATADHRLRGAGEYCEGIPAPHLDNARLLPFAGEAEAEFAVLTARDDWRLLLWFLIQEEITRRAVDRKLKDLSVTGEFAQVEA